MRIAHVLRGSAAILAFSLVGALPAAAQVLYDNGPVVDNNGLSIIRPGGNLLGLGAQVPSNFVAEDFSVAGSGWNVSGFSFFAYETNAGAFSFTGLTWSIVSGDVNIGPTVASGSLAPTNGGLQGYRVTSGTLTNQARAIFQLDADVIDFTLGAGNYWLRWSIDGSPSFTGPWQPYTSDGAVGNAHQSIGGGDFNQAVDSGDQLGVELPFIIRGTAAVPEPSSLALMLVGGLGMMGMARRRRLSR